MRVSKPPVTDQQDSMVTVPLRYRKRRVGAVVVDVRKLERLITQSESLGRAASDAKLTQAERREIRNATVSSRRYALRALKEEAGDLLDRLVTDAVWSRILPGLRVLDRRTPGSPQRYVLRQRWFQTVLADMLDRGDLIGFEKTVANLKYVSGIRPGPKGPRRRWPATVDSDWRAARRELREIAMKLRHGGTRVSVWRQIQNGPVGRRIETAGLKERFFLPWTPQKLAAALVACEHGGLPEAALLKHVKTRKLVK